MYAPVNSENSNRIRNFTNSKCAKFLIIFVFACLLITFQKYKNSNSILKMNFIALQLKLNTMSSTNGSTIYRVVTLGESKKSVKNYVTVVTTLFQFGKSKHPVESYEMWSENMIKSLGTPFVAFVDFNWSQKFIKICKEQNLTGTVLITDSIWSIMREFENYRGRSYITAYFLDQTKMDPEKRIHSPELYAIWNLKTYLLDKVARLNPYKSNFFIYTDSGAWRNKVFPNWPDIEFVKTLETKLDNRILYGQVAEPQKFFLSEKFPIKKNFIEGTFFAGTAKAIRKIYEHYYDLHDEWLDLGLFIGKDQTLMNELTNARAKYDIARLKTNNLNCKQTYDVWFFYQYYFAQPYEYICYEDKLSLVLS